MANQLVNQPEISLLHFHEEGSTYEKYLAIVADLVKAEKTTGPNQSEAMVHYTKMAWQRMKRWNKTYKLNPEFFDLLQELRGKQLKALSITEAWCGDAAHLVPLFNIISKVADINMKCILRDEHEELINAFLTNGGKSIPIFVVFSEEGEYLFHWGPRPAPMQKRVLQYKEKKDKPFEEFLQETQVWYNQDKGATTQAELYEHFLHLH